MPLKKYSHTVQYTFQTLSSGKLKKLSENPPEILAMSFAAVADGLRDSIRRNELEIFQNELEHMSFLYEESKKQQVGRFDFLDEYRHRYPITYTYDSRPVLEALFLGDRAQLLSVVDALMALPSELQPKFQEAFIAALKQTEIPEEQLFNIDLSQVRANLDVLTTQAKNKKVDSKSKCLMDIVSNVNAILNEPVAAGKSKLTQDAVGSTLDQHLSAFGNSRIKTPQQQLTVLQSKLRIEQAFLKHQTILSTHRGYKDILANMAAGLFVGYLIGVAVMSIYNKKFTPVLWKLTNTASQNLVETAQKNSLGFKR